MLLIDYEIEMRKLRDREEEELRETNLSPIANIHMKKACTGEQYRQTALPHSDKPRRYGQMRGRPTRGVGIRYQHIRETHEEELLSVIKAYNGQCTQSIMLMLGILNPSILFSRELVESLSGARRTGKQIRISVASAVDAEAYEWAAETLGSLISSADVTLIDQPFPRFRYGFWDFKHAILSYADCRGKEFIYDPALAADKDELVTVLEGYDWSCTERTVIPSSGRSLGKLDRRAAVVYHWGTDSEGEGKGFDVIWSGMRKEWLEYRRRCLIETEDYRHSMPQDLYTSADEDIIRPIDDR